jgi:Putative phage serine protease XkdF
MKRDTTGVVIKAGNDENRFLLLVAYSANKMPQRGADNFVDIVRPEVLEKACWRFMDNGARVGMWHQEGNEQSARIVENYIYRNEVPWVIKAPNGEQQVIKQGDWVCGLILEPDTWELYKSGKIGGASPQGSAKRKRASSELLAKYQ